MRENFNIKNIYFMKIFKIHNCNINNTPKVTKQIRNKIPHLPTRIKIHVTHMNVNVLISYFCRISTFFS